MLTVFSVPPVQGQSSREVRETIKEHEQALDVLITSQEQVNVNVDSIAKSIQMLTEAISTVVQNRETITSPIRTQEHVNVLFAVLYGILNLVINGIALSFSKFRAFVERYASKSVLAVATGVLLALIATVTSKGDANIVQILLYLINIVGTHFASFTLLRKAPASEPAPVG